MVDNVSLCKKAPASNANAADCQSKVLLGRCIVCGDWHRQAHSGTLIPAKCEFTEVSVLGAEPNEYPVGSKGRRDR